MAMITLDVLRGGRKVGELTADSDDLTRPGDLARLGRGWLRRGRWDRELWDAFTVAGMVGGRRVEEPADGG